jgi:hypothetical protein
MSVPDPRAVKVKGQIELIADFPDFKYLFLRENRSAMAIVGVFKRH